jgi:hypothetical protein
MGNQLFQYAGALRLATANGLVLGVDKYTGFRHDAYGRTYALDNFRITGHVLEEQEASECLLKYRTSRLTFKTIEYLARRYGGRNFVKQLAELKTDGGMLEAYFQHPRYFADVSDRIRAEFRFSSAIDPSACGLQINMLSSESVALHIRRYHGDTTGDGKEHFGLQPSYYQAALRVIQEQIKDPQVFVFGDCPEWARVSLELPANTVLVQHDSVKADVEDLRLMTTCKHHIISNSTFSWWGAWLASNIGVVCCPRDFSPDLKGHYLDSYPEHWHVV